MFYNVDHTEASGHVDLAPKRTARSRLFADLGASAESPLWTSRSIASSSSSSSSPNSCNSLSCSACSACRVGSYNCLGNWTKRGTPVDTAHRSRQDGLATLMCFMMLIDVWWLKFSDDAFDYTQTMMGQACPPHMRIFLPCTQVSHASCRSANSGRDLWLPHAFHWQRPKLLAAQMGQLWLGEQGGMQGCKRLCNESRILECILLFGVGNIGNTCSSHSCLNEIFLTSIWTHAVFLVLSFYVESLLVQDGQLPPEYPGRPEEQFEERVGLGTLPAVRNPSWPSRIPSHSILPWLFPQTLQRVLWKNLFHNWHTQ